MAYREKVFNANVLTDLLSTYLTHRAGEREKYYEAEQQANKPQYRTVDGNLVEISRDGQVKTLMSKQQQEKAPKFEDFTKDGTTYKGQFMGKDYTQTPEDIEVGMPKSYQYTGFSKAQFKPEDPKAIEKKIEDKNIAAMVSEVARLRRLRDKDYDFATQYMIDQGRQAPVFTKENEKQLEFYTTELSKRGFDIYGKEKKSDSSVAPKAKKGSFWE
tara:strand:+ start:9109 stop:9753 length:645 start_codon:yes stop_codon:yes gene_type:complete